MFPADWNALSTPSLIPKLPVLHLVSQFALFSRWDSLFLSWAAKQKTSFYLTGQSVRDASLCHLYCLIDSGKSQRDSFLLFPNIYEVSFKALLELLLRRYIYVHQCFYLLPSLPSFLLFSFDSDVFITRKKTIYMLFLRISVQFNGHIKFLIPLIFFSMALFYYHSHNQGSIETVYFITDIGMVFYYECFSRR